MDGASLCEHLRLSRRSFDKERAHLTHEGGEGRVVGAEGRRAQQLERLGQLHRESEAPSLIATWFGLGLGLGFGLGLGLGLRVGWRSSRRDTSSQPWLRKAGTRCVPSAAAPPCT